MPCNQYWLIQYEKLNLQFSISLVYTVTASDANLLVEILKTCSAEYRQQLVEMVATYLDEHPLRLSHLDWVPTELLIPSILHSRILQS